MNFNDRHGIQTIIGFGLIVLDIIFKNGNKNPFYASGGTCSNVITNLSFLGWTSSIISRVGTDSAADILLTDLNQSCVNTNNLFRENGVKSPRIIESLIFNTKESSHKFILRCPECKTYLPRFRSPTLKQINDLLISDLETNIFFYDRISPASIALAKKFKSKGSLVIFEPNSVKMNEQLKKSLDIPHVIKFAFDENKDKEHLKQFEDEILRLKGKSPLLIIKTMGHKGICYKQKQNKKWKHQNAIKVDSILDTCGAGDWCTAGFIYALNKLSFSKGQKILDSFNDQKIISNALKVGQAIASVSLNYVGARGLSYAINKKQLFSKINKLIDFDHIGFNKDNFDYECINKSVFKPKKDSHCRVCLI